MDLLAAIGLASNILSFIDFSYKLITGARQIAKNGSTDENNNVDAIVRDLDQLVGGLQQEPRGTSPHETALRELALKCKTLSGDLSSLLETLKADPGPKWESIRAILRSTRKKGVIAEKMSMLAEYRSEILARLLFLLNERQTLIHVQVNNLERGMKEKHHDLVNLLTNLQAHVLKAIDGRTHEQENTGLTENEQLSLEKVRATLVSLLEPSRPPSPETRILRQLHFNQMHFREDSVRDAESGTFEWILSEQDGKKAETSGLSGRQDDGRMAWEIDRARSLQLQTRSTFLEWLSAGNGIFHISGKAGSGKSTLMKLLAHHHRTREELDKWSGDKRLVFAQFFAWRAGDNMQNSLHGLCRSILFTVLKQCIDLIPEVFPDAYHTFSTTPYERYIDEPFFRFAALWEGLQKLIAMSMNRGCRFCFFIDGLDEFKNDATHDLSHEDLADILTSWAKNGDVKLLVSSRPYDEFMSAFSSELRIKLHELTRLDITRFGRQMFEKHKSFNYVRDLYEDLVDKVVAGSEGVFLWARLAIRIVLSAIPTIRDAKTLRKLLDEVPPDIDDLYRNLLDSINPSCRARVLKMLWLVGNLGRCRALSITWIDELFERGSSFLAKYQIGTYSRTEMKRRVQEAEYLVLQTKGLLEISPGSAETGPASVYVDVFHRTIRDFVNRSEQMRTFSAPESNKERLWFKMRLAELWFLKPKPYHDSFGDLMRQLQDRVRRVDNDEDTYDWMDALETVVRHHNRNGRTNFPGWATSGFNAGNLGASGTEFSPLHWVAGYTNNWEYLRRKLQDKPELIHANRGRLSLLLSAALSEGDTPMLDRLLEMGASPNELVRLCRPQGNVEASVWMIFCGKVAYFAVDRREWADYRRIFLNRLKVFLNTRKVDSNVSIVLAPTGGADGTHIILLKDLVQQLDKDNIGLWDKLFSPGGTVSKARSLQNMRVYLATQGICVGVEPSGGGGLELYGSVKVEA
ncbi:hypothetical protein AAE478_004782 [Parahypoxylon ruwenzoriense]